VRTNGQSPEQIQADIDRTRGDMDSTLDAIEQRLTPGQLVDQGLDYLRRSGGNEFVSNLGGSVRDNPLPIALVGIGLAWLMAAGKSGNAGDRARSAKEAYGSMKQQASSGMQSARDTASQIGQTARQQAQRAKSGMDYLVNDHPLGLGAIGLAIGAVLAGAAPRTRQEDALMGEASDRLAGQAKQAGSDQLQKVKQMASAVTKEKTDEKPAGPYVDVQAGDPG
jgi:ElaB/YqjD/DUF883 family membrane-anchored ribosome-binding protein